MLVTVVIRMKMGHESTKSLGVTLKNSGMVKETPEGQRLK